MVMPASETSVIKLLRIILLVFAGFLMTMHIVSVLLPLDLSQFDLDNEHNVPTVYTSLLLGCSALLCLLSLRNARLLAEKFLWVLLAILYLYMGFDESLVIHESFAEPIRHLLSIANNNPLYHAWVIPAIVLFSGLGVFAYALKATSKVGPQQLKIVLLTLISAGGVIALEIIGTQLYFSNTVYKLGPVLIEEMLEISMMSLILFTLVSNFLLNQNPSAANKSRKSRRKQ